MPPPRLQNSPPHTPQATGRNARAGVGRGREGGREEACDWPGVKEMLPACGLPSWAGSNSCCMALPGIEIVGFCVRFWVGKWVICAVNSAVCFFSIPGAARHSPKGLHFIHWFCSVLFFPFFGLQLPRVRLQFVPSARGHPHVLGCIDRSSASHSCQVRGGGCLECLQGELSQETPPPKVHPE